MTALAIDVHDLRKRFGTRQVINGLTLQVPEGEICGFLGGNGSGKTTTIRMLCGLLRPDGGGGTCLGMDLLRDAARIRLQIGYMTQRFSFYGDLTVVENLEFVARLYQIRDYRRVISGVLERIGLTDRADQLAQALSGGWKQRMALAACMLHSPMLLLLDEPTAGVDPKARRDFWDELQGLAARGISVLVSTHYMDEASRCHKLAYIAYGRLLAQGTAAEVIAGQNLSSWAIYGTGLIELQDKLRTQRGVEQTVIFGDGLHVSGKDAAILEQSVQNTIAGGDFRAERIETGLEDVFIYMMSRSADNFGGQS